MRRLLGKVDDGRFGRALAGLIFGQFAVEGVVRHADGSVFADVVSVSKSGRRVYGVGIGKRGAHCTCSDFRQRQVLCKHIAALALYELGAAAQARSEHRTLPVQPAGGQ